MPGERSTLPSSCETPGQRETVSLRALKDQGDLIGVFVASFLHFVAEFVCVAGSQDQKQSGGPMFDTNNNLIRRVHNHILIKTSIPVCLSKHSAPATFRLAEPK